MNIESVRLSVAKSSPLSAALDTCVRLVDEEAVAAVVGVVANVIKTGVGTSHLVFFVCGFKKIYNWFRLRVSGLPTLTAAAKVAVNLATNENIATQMKENSSQLLKTFQAGLLDQSPSVRKMYAGAIGHLARVVIAFAFLLVTCELNFFYIIHSQLCFLAPLKYRTYFQVKRKRLSQLVLDLTAMYTDTSKGSDKERLVAGLTLSAICRRGGEAAKDYQVDFVPVAFVALHDTDKEVVEVGY